MKHRCTRASKQKIPPLIQFLTLCYSLSDRQTQTVMKKLTTKTRLTLNTHTLFFIPACARDDLDFVVFLQQELSQLMKNNLKFRVCATDFSFITQMKMSNPGLKHPKHDRCSRI